MAMTNLTTPRAFEYEVIVNRYGNVGVFRRYAEPIVKSDGTTLRFWAYACSIKDAVARHRDAPLTIISRA